MMQTERRSAPRQGLDSLLYLDLEPDNGGILLNLSETGMQISVAKRLVTSTELRFTLCLKPKEKISGTGRIAWLSPSGRSAGVHFLDLPEGARLEIRQWMGKSADSLTSEDKQSLDVPRQDSPRMESAVAQAMAAPAPPEPEPAAPAIVSPPLSTEKDFAPCPDVSAPVVQQAPEIVVPTSQAAEPATAAPPTIAVETVQLSQLALDQPATAETAGKESPASEASAPLPMDPLELLGSTVESETLEVAPLPWTQPSMPPIEALRADDADPHPSVLALYGIDSREKEQKTFPEPAPAQPSPHPPNERTPNTAAVERMKRRAEARNRARAAARAPRQPQRAPKPIPVILDGLIDVALTPKSSAPAAAKATTGARPKLTNPLFIPAPPQFQLPPPEMPPSDISARVPPTFDPHPSEPAMPQTRLEHPFVSAPAFLPEPPNAQNSRTSGALYLPNYRVRGITPDGSWRSTRLFLNPLMAVPEIFDRFEAFGSSLEGDWHVWIALILLFAGFLALAQKPPLVVLTIAFWFAGAVVVLDRRRPDRGPMRPQKRGRN
jgi:hypothetical protein